MVDMVEIPGRRKPFSLLGAMPRQRYDDPDGLFQALEEPLGKAGLITDGWLQAICQRERAYPSGLRLPDGSVAIPHVGTAYVDKPYILAIRLPSPVTFGEMGSATGQVATSYVFNLGITDATMHLDVLQDLMRALTEKDLLTRLDLADDARMLALLLEEALEGEGFPKAASQGPDLLDASFPQAPPLHVQLSNALREKIHTRTWHPNTQIPSEHELCRRFGISRGTVRRAIKSLVDEGVLEQRHGVGTFVAEPGIYHPAGVRSLSFAESFHKQGLAFTTHVVSKTLCSASPQVADALGVAVGSPVLHLVRVRSVEGNPMTIQDSWLNLQPCPGLDRCDFSQVSAFDAVQETSGKAITCAHIRYSARKADPSCQKLLKLDAQDPVLVLEQQIELQDGQTIEWSFTWLKQGQEVVGTATQHQDHGLW